MPQMAPMNWLSLFIMFTITFLIFNSMNFFSFFYNYKLSKFNKTTKLINWKW
uniref:ATP synthase complex subunit 8 n=1 Tax=Staphylinidae sp. BMNH 1274679 TaxID=1796593 RepID=A0A140EG09_9COLE|nr:ATP synthase F0 subunit 8 [Staphylinidae sp. BMNH 1274679]